MTPTDDEAALAVLAGCPPLCIRCGRQSVASGTILCAACHNKWINSNLIRNNFRAFVGLHNKPIPKWIAHTWPYCIFGDKQP